MGSLSEKDIVRITQRPAEIGQLVSSGSSLFTDRKSGEQIVTEIEKILGEKIHPLEQKVIEELSSRRDRISQDCGGSTILFDAKMFLHTAFEAAIERDPNSKLLMNVNLANEMLDRGSPPLNEDLFSGEIENRQIYGLGDPLIAVTHRAVLLYNNADKSSVPSSVEKLLVRVVRKTLQYVHLPDNIPYAYAIGDLLGQLSPESMRFLEK